MKFVKVGDELDSPKAVALGFAEKDDLILKDFVNDILYDDYVSIYFVNVEDNSFRTIKSSNVSWVDCLWCRNTAQKNRGSSGVPAEGRPFRDLRNCGTGGTAYP